MSFHIRLFSRPGCHLCDDVEGHILKVAEEYPIELEIIDIRTNFRFEEKYMLTIPVVEIDGEEVFVSTTSVMSEEELREELEERSQKF